MSGVLTVDDKIIYTKYQLDSDQLIEKVHGITRDTQNYVTAIPLDYFLVGKSITSNTSLIAPNCRSNTFTFLSDTDIDGVPRFQTKAFTNEMGSFLNDIVTNKTLTLGSSTIAEVSSHLTLTSPYIKCNGILSMINSTSANRTINCSFYNILGDNVTSDGRMWLGATSLYIQNFLNSGDITFLTRDVAGTQSTRMSLSKTAIQINADTINSVGSAINVNASTAYGCTSPIISLAATTLNLGGLVPSLFTTYLSAGSLTFGDSTTQTTAMTDAYLTTFINNTAPSIEGSTVNNLTVNTLTSENIKLKATTYPLTNVDSIGYSYILSALTSVSMTNNTWFIPGSWTLPKGVYIISQSWSHIASGSVPISVCTFGISVSGSTSNDAFGVGAAGGNNKRWDFTITAEWRETITSILELNATTTVYAHSICTFTGSLTCRFYGTATRIA